MLLSKCKKAKQKEKQKQNVLVELVSKQDEFLFLTFSPLDNTFT